MVIQPTLVLARAAGQSYAVIAPAQGEVEVRWQVRAKSTGHFELLRGPDLFSMQLIDAQPALGGDQRYSYTDRHQVGDGCLYRLTFVDDNGREVSLGTVFCREAGAEPTAAVPVVHRELIDLPPDFSVLGPHRIETVAPEPQTTELPWDLVPPVPPPECGWLVQSSKPT